MKAYKNLRTSKKLTKAFKTELNKVTHKIGLYSELEQLIEAATYNVLTDTPKDQNKGLVRACYFALGKSKGDISLANSRAELLTAFADQREYLDIKQTALFEIGDKLKLFDE